MDRTHLLIIDSHKSHVYNYPFLQYMLSNNIQVMEFPAHCSYIVQPLDNVPFACFKRLWEKHLDNWNFQHLGALIPAEKMTPSAAVGSIGKHTRKHEANYIYEAFSVEILPPSPPVDANRNIH